MNLSFCAIRSEKVSARGGSRFDTGGHCLKKFNVIADKASK
jgi:hypothetical protein